MEVKEFITNLNRSNFSLSVDNGKLNLTGDKKKLSAAEIDGIKSNREVIDYIKANKNEIIEHLTLYSDLSSVKRSKNISSIYRLSGLQQGMLFHGLYEGETEAYKVQFKCELVGLNEKAFTDSWKYLLRRHTILRSGFYYDAFNVPVQCVYNDVELPVEILDFRNMNESEKEVAVKEYAAADLRKGFDFKTPPLMRVALIRLSDKLHRMQWTSHHILFDGWSLPILMEEFLSTYELLAAGKEVKITTEDKYEDYIRYIDRTDKAKEEAHWRNYMQGVEQSTLLPFVETTTERTKGAGAYQSVVLHIDAATTLAIQEFAQYNRLTVSTIVQGVWSLLLHRYTGSDHVVFGVVVSGRPEDLPGVEQRVGMFINTLPSHSAWQGDTQIINWLQNLQNEQILSRQYQHTPLSNIQQWAGVKGDFFDSLLVFENYPVSKIVKANQWSIGIENVLLHDPTNYPLTILINNAEQLSIHFNYNTKLLDAEYVQAIRNHFEHVLLQITNGKDARLSDIKLLVPAEERMLLDTFNDTKKAYPENKTIVDLFEEQANRIPHNTAQVYKNNSLTYFQLNEKVNRLAHYLLQEYNLKADDTIGVLINRSEWSAIAMLAIIKTGACYVPIDYELPKSRLEYIVSDAAPKVILTGDDFILEYSFLLPGGFVSLTSLVLEDYSGANPGIPIHLDSLSFVIYTSGSTGNPKGVMQTHRTLLNLVTWEINSSGIQPGLKLLQYASFAFDLSLLDVCFSLSNGGSFYVLEEEVRLHFPKLAAYISDNGIELLALPFSALSSFFNNVNFEWLRNNNIKHIISTGEQLLIGEKLDEFMQLYPHIILHNFYGPSETHVVTAASFTHKQLQPRHATIGKPIDNSTIYILDKNRSPVPVGVTGEVFIGGDNLARGYLKNKVLTDEKFIPHFFNPHELLYKVGDLGRWLPGGNIEYLGRIDDQVKIRGYRIELGEIENVLQQSGLIRHVVVLAKKDKGGNNRLVGYAMAAGKLDRDAILKHLQRKLPDYMIPTLWVELETLPLTPNGKVDKRALPNPDPMDLFRNEYEAPRNNLEQKLAAIWQELLGIEKVGINNNFFEIGGHSLLAMRVISLVRRRLQTEVGIKDLFIHPTIAELADYIRLQSGESLVPQITVQPRPEHIPLSFSQERLWFVDRYEGSVQYHLPAVLKLNGNLNVEGLQYAFQNIVVRHEVLRTVIRDQDGSGYQVVQDAGKWELDIHSRIDVDTDNEDLVQSIQNVIKKPFDLSRDHMLRASLITLRQQEYVLVVVMHHIASDGWSLSVLVKEVIQLYEAYIEKRTAQLLALPVQYADYAIWQRAYLQGDLWEQKLGYWKTKLEGVSPLQLPTDFTRPAIQNLHAASVPVYLHSKLTGQLTALGHQHGATLFMTLMAAFKTLLYRYSGQQDICVGTPIANRTIHEVENLIGFFINTLALRSHITGELSFTELLQDIKQTTLEAYTHQDVPFEKVIDAVVKQRDISRNPLVQVMFILQNTPDIPHLKLGEVALAKDPFTPDTTRFDLTFSLIETETGLYGSVQYSTALFRQDTIERMVGHFENLLNAIVISPEQSVAVLPMLDKAEEEKLLVEFNDTATLVPEDTNTVTLLEVQAAKSPEAIALQFGKEELTYRELHHRSNQLAHYLRARGIKENTRVPICIDKSFEMIIGIIGILKAGAAYVPVDPAYPADRIGFMIADSEATIILSADKEVIGPKLANSAAEVVYLDSQWSEIQSDPTVNVNVAIQPEHLVYVLYTSGSTGKPKGVQVQHSSFTNHLLWFNQQYHINEKDSTLFLSSFSFDGGMTALWPVLMNGGTLHLPQNDLMDTDRIRNYLSDNAITYLKTLPGIFKTIVHSGSEYETLSKSIRLVIVGGEKMNAGEFKNYSNNYPHVTFANHYGPTECTISSSYYVIDKHSQDNYTTQSIVGKPVANTIIYIVGEKAQLAPIGIPGEIWIGGAGVAKGYINNPALTEQKFSGDPFSTVPGARVYKTGDTGRWLADGNVEYIGRLDDQVKIRGYRIELSEIETVLQQSDLVQQAVVLAKGDSNGNQRLVGYVLADNFDRGAIISYLKTKLPEYMVPLLWLDLESFPLTPNGKIDKNVFPDPDASLIQPAFTEPRNEIETKLTEIWQKLLRKERISIYDNFFEAGGNSLLAMQVVASIRKKLNVDIAIKDLFIYPTIAELAIHVAAQNGETLLPNIEVQVRPPYIPLSFSQERLWFMDRLHGSVQYHLPSVLKLTGKLQMDGLQYALQQIVNRHQVLRTVIRENSGHGYQHVLDENGMPLSFVDGLEYENDEDGLQAYIQSLISLPFDISEDHMVRAHLIKRNADEHLLVIILHHIASDKWSSSVFVKEVVELYDSYVQNRKPNLAPLPLQYADFAIWQRHYLDAGFLDEKLAYWKEKLNGIEPLELPVDYPRPPVQSNKGNIVNFSIDKQLGEQLKELSRQQESTLFMTILAAYQILLHRYSGQQDICVGTSTAGRQQHEVENLIGFFVNILALRNTVSNEEPFATFLQTVKQTTLGAYSHQEVPFEKVVDAVVQERNRSRSPIFQVMLVMLNTPEISNVALEGLTLSGAGYETISSKYDITFFIRETPEGIKGAVEYNTELFKEQTIRRMVGHFDHLLHSIVSQPQQVIAALPMLNKTEEQQILNEFNNTSTAYPHDKTIVDLFEEQVELRQDAIALVFEEEEISYTVLNEKANRLANYLKSKGVTEESLVPVCMERGIDLIVSILAILKAGAAYVPVDASYPQHRIDFILEDINAAIAVTTQQNKVRLSNAKNIDIVDVEAEAFIIDAQSSSNLQNVIKPHHLAYVIYTSGSTGKPKGVLAEHGNVVSLVSGVSYVSLTNQDILLSTGSPTFDATTFEFWSMLLNGGQLILCPENKLLNTDLLKEEIRSKKVNIMWFTSGWFNQLTDADITVFETLTTILVGGEKLSEKHIATFRNTYPSIDIINGYGPTENTTFSLTYLINETEISSTIPIGKPLSNRTAYVLNNNQQLCPVGVVGEIYAGGKGVTRGYLNQPALTAEKFIADPFSAETGARLYKTGDLGRWLPDGNIEYFGRRDDQVKIRGFRIELGEIESVLQELEEVSQAVLTVSVDREGTKRLVGYIVPNRSFDKDAILRNLNNKLPEYMIPAMLLEIEELPLNANGKVDRKALPDPDESEVHTKEFVAPRNHNEQVLASIWESLLDLDQVGIHDNFFEIGGDSLLAIRVVSAIRKELEIEISIGNLFEYQTIALLAAQIETTLATTLLPAIIPAARPDKIPLSYSQQRLWFIDKLEGSTQYHLPAVLRLKGHLNVQALQHALGSIVKRHEVLRTNFPEQGGEAWQQIKEVDEWKLTIIDGSSFFQDVSALRKIIQQTVSAPFDLSADYMLRADLITLTGTENILIINLHHIASDGWSHSILVKEIAELYTAFEEGRQPVLLPLPIQYADFSIWQQNYLQGELLDSKMRYWNNKLKGVAPMQLPADFVRPPIQTSRGNSVVFSIEKETTAALQRISNQNGSTLFMTLLSVLKILLYRYTSNEDICVGTASAGRQQQEVEGLIGFFINTLALRSAVQPDDTFATLLKGVKQTTLEAYEHQDVPFEKIVDALTVKRDRSRNPVFQVMFVLQNTPEIPEIQLGNLMLSSENFGHNTAQFDLSFSLTEHAGGLHGTVVYNSDIYLPETINRIVGHFKELADSIIKAPAQKISQLSMLPEAEKQRLLVDFNDTATIFPQNKTIVDLIEEQAVKNPIAIAVTDEAEHITYDELNRRSNQLAHYLQHKGVNAGKLVPVCMERSISLIVSLLAIVKTGAAYVPIDPGYPADRIRFMLQDINAAFILSDTSGKHAITTITDVELIEIDTDWQIIASHPTANPAINITSDNLAYVIYTSGSTGTPKGVMIEHASLANLVYWHRTEYKVTADSKATAMAGVGFDAFGWEVWPYLTAGASVHIISNEQKLSAIQLVRLFSANNITHSFIATALISEFVKASQGKELSLQYLLTGGDKLTVVDTSGINYALINNYGPTENTVVATNYPVGQKDNAYPIGKPIANTSIYIVDKNNSLAGTGVPGEICIGGANLARGYLNQPQLTAEKFIKSPFTTNPASRLYKTGDIGRWLPDGNIEYLGRVDEQVKVLGYRIELGEIEIVLQQSGLVQQSVVVAKADGGGVNRLVGYVVAKDGFNREGVVSYLRAKLPKYMVPALWIKLESLPLTANGKVDKKALPDPDAGGHVNTPYAAPRNQTESKLAEIWQELLHKDRVGIHDNFFELGGHSLLVMRLISAINQQMGVELFVKDIFEFSTISELGKYLEVQLSLIPDQKNEDEFDLVF